VPGGKDALGQWVYDEVLRYLFTHPVDQSGPAVPMDADCDMGQRAKCWSKNLPFSSSSQTTWVILETAMADTLSFRFMDDSKSSAPGTAVPQLRFDAPKTQEVIAE